LPRCSEFLAFLFADDTTLLLSHENFDYLVEMVNIELKKISLFFRAHKLSLHPKKTKFMIFSNSPNVRNSEPVIFIDFNNEGEDDLNRRLPLGQIKCSDDEPYIRFLGVLIDPVLSYSHHVKLIISKLSRALYVLRTVKHVLPMEALKSIYYSLFHCHLIYCISVWSSASQSLISKLTKMQKDAIRLILNKPYNAHTEPLFKELKILPFDKLLLYFNLQIMQRYIQGFLPSAFNNVWITNQARRDEALNFNDNMANDQLVVQRILRNSENLNIPFARLAFSTKQPYVNLPKTWTEFTEESIKILRNKLEFNFKLKKHLLDQLSSTIICSRLLCPACHLNIN